MTTNPRTHESEPGVYPPGQHEPPPPSPGKSKKRGLIWAVFLLIIAGVAGYAVWSAGHPAAGGQKGQGGAGGAGGAGGRGAALGPVPVVVTKVTRSSIPVIQNGIGNVAAYYTVTVKSRVDGQLMKLHFNEGDLVKEGQLLAEIDPRPYQVQLDMAQATLAHDQAVLANARVDLERYTKLVETDAIPSQQLDTQKALVTQFQATIQQDQATIENAKLQLVYSKVTAPITGVVGLRLVDPGNIVHAADTTGMIVITQLQPISVIFPVAEDQLPAVLSRWRAGQKLVVEAWDRADQRKIAAGYLATIDNEIDQTTGTLRLRANFDNADYQLFPNQFVNAHMLVQEKTGVTLINNAAVQRNTNETYVWLLKPDSTVTVRDINTGTAEGDLTEVTSGLEAGDGVVMTGVDKLVEGAKVVSQWGDQSPATGSGGGKGSRKSGGKGK